MLLVHGVSDGPFTDVYALAPLANRVEKAWSPESIIGKAGPAMAWPGRTRPLCMYLQQAHYKDSGSSEDATSFTWQ